MPDERSHAATPPRRTSRRFIVGAAFAGLGAGALAGGRGAAYADAQTAAELATPKGGATAVAYNVKDHGAKGDGTTDDSGAINRLIAAVSGTGGGIIEFPHGKYALASSVMLGNGVYLVSGAENHGYIPTSTATTTAMFLALPGLTGYVVDSPTGGIVSAGIDGIDVQGTGTTGGIRLQDASWCVVSKSQINQCGLQGVLQVKGFACVFEDLLTTNCVLNRSPAATMGAFDIAGTDHYVTRCEFGTSSTKKSSPAKRVVAAAIRGSNHFVSDVVGEISDIGFYVSATVSRFSNVRSDTNWGDGWRIDGTANMFAACSSVGNSQSTPNVDDGWVVTGGGNSFAACSVHTTPSTTVRYGFNDSVNTALAAQRNNYAACTVDHAGTAAWKTAGYLGSAPEVSAHPIRPADGSTTIDVTQSSLIVLFDMTSITTVTAFANGVTGQTIRLLGSSAVTIANNATIHTTTNAPKRLATNGVYSFTYYDGQWYEM